MLLADPLVFILTKSKQTLDYNGALQSTAARQFTAIEKKKKRVKSKLPYYLHSIILHPSRTKTKRHKMTNHIESLEPLVSL